MQLDNRFLDARLEDREQEQADDTNHENRNRYCLAKHREGNHRDGKQDAGQANGKRDAAEPVDMLLDKGSRRRIIPQITPNMPIGTLKRKTQRQDASVSRPPMIGPSRKPAAPAIWLMPRPRPTCPLRNASVTMAVLFVTMSAPPTPCTTRPKMRSAPWNCGCAIPAISEPSENITKPLL